MRGMDIIFTLSGLQGIGRTQAQIAAEIPCSQPTISDMASGKAGIVRPSYKIVSGLERLAKKYGVPTDPPENAAPSARRATDLVPDPSHPCRQPPATNAIANTLPLRATVGIEMGAKP